MESLNGSQLDASEKKNNFPLYLMGSHCRTEAAAAAAAAANIGRQNRGGSTTKRLVRRLIKKNGTSNIFRSKNSTLWERYIRDLANTLVDSRWRWTIISLTSCFLLSWIIFACAWMLISNVNGDFDTDNPSETPCLSGIVGFGGYIMFSMETQQTIGYGSRYITHYCPEGTFLMCLQIILGCAICGAMVSIVNAKMVRPPHVYYKNSFSKNAVVCLRDGVLCLVFRIRDQAGRYAMGTSISAYLVQSRVEEPYLKSIRLEPSGLLLWPLEVVHKITPSSPFYDLSPKEIITKRFELIVVLQGSSVITGQCSKSQSSYLSNEILWGYRFKPCIHYDNYRHCYVVNHEHFNQLEEVLTPLCSAQRLKEVMSDISALNDAKSEAGHRLSIYDNLSDDTIYKNDPLTFELHIERMLESLQDAIRLKV